MAGILAGIAYVDIVPRFTAFNKAMATGLDKVAGTLDKFGKGLTKKLTLPVAALGAVSVKTAVDFEASMSKITGLVGIAAGEVDKMGQSLLALSPKVGKGPKELADALFFITSSGFKGAEALDILEASARASAAGLGDTQVVADAVTSAVNAYGIANLSAAKATDILTATVREGKGEASELAGVIGRVIPIASEVGVEFDEVGAAISAMTLTGLDAAEAVTALRGFLSLLLKPAQQSRERLDQLGLSASDVAQITQRLDLSLAKGGLSVQKLRDIISKQGLLEGMSALSTAIGDNRDALGDVIPNVRALTGFLSITGKNAEKNAKIFAALADATGSTDKAFLAAATTARFKFNQALAHLQVAAVKVGNTLIPIVTKLADFVGRLVDGFSQLPGPVRAGVVAFLGVTAALGPLLRLGAAFIRTWQAMRFAIFNVRAAMYLLRGSFTNVSSILSLFRSGLSGLVSGLASLRNLINPVTAAIGIATVAFLKWRKGKRELRDITNDLTEALKEEAKGTKEASDQAILRRLAEGGVLERLREERIEIPKVVRAIKGDAAARREVLAEINEMIRSRASHGKEIGRELPLLKRLFEGYDAAAKTSQALTASEGELGLTTDETTDAIEKQTDGLDGMDAAFDKVNEAVSKFEDQLQRVLGVHIDAREASATYEQAIDDLAESLKENGRTFDLHTEKGRNNQSALHDVLTAAEDYASALRSSGAIQNTDKAQKQKTIDLLVAAQRQYPKLRGQIQQYIDKIKTIPEETVTEAQFDPHPARTAIDKFIADLKDPRLRKIEIEAGVQGTVSLLAGGLGSSKAEPVYVRVINEGFPGNALGGAVTAGSPSIVGEVGPELFVPRVSGQILAYKKLRAALHSATAANPDVLIGSGGDVTFNSEIHLHTPTAIPADVAKRLTEAVMRDVARRLRGAGKGMPGTRVVN